MRHKNCSHSRHSPFWLNTAESWSKIYFRWTEMLNNFYHHINRVLLLLPILIPCITHGKELFPNCLHNEIFVFNTTATQQLENHASELHHDHLVMPIYCTDTRYSNCKAIPIPEQKVQDLFLKLRHLRLRHLRLTLMCVYTEELMCNLSACHSSVLSQVGNLCLFTPLLLQADCRYIIHILKENVSNPWNSIWCRKPYCAFPAPYAIIRTAVPQLKFLNKDRKSQKF